MTLPPTNKQVQARLMSHRAVNGTILFSTVVPQARSVSIPRYQEAPII